MTLSSHGIQDDANIGKFKLCQCLLPAPLRDHPALGRVQEGGESARGLANDGREEMSEAGTVAGTYGWISQLMMKHP